MKNQIKRLLSLALAVVMTLALMPANILPAHAEGELTVTAYPKEIAVGQTSSLIVTGMTGSLTFKSDNDAVATVAEDGIVIGGHSGTAKITVTDTNGATGTYDMVVSATSVYNISANVFNIGNDTNKDGEFTDADDYGGNAFTLGDGSTVTPPVWGQNPSLTSKYVPFYVTGSSSSGDSYKSDDNASDNGYIRYRGRESLLWFYPMWSGYSTTSGKAYDYRENEKYFTSYDYLNLNKTDPWQWIANYSSISFDYRIRPTATYIRGDIATIQTQGFPDTIYTTFKIDVPASGEYKITIDTGNSGTLSEVFYLTPVGDITTANATTLCNADNKIITIDISKNTIGSAVKTLNKGEYYLTLQLVKGTASTDKGYLKSITLDLNEIDEPVIDVDSTKLNVGDTSTLSVSQTSSFEGTKTLSNATYVSSNPDVIHVTSSEGVATVTALAKGEADVTVSYTDLCGNNCTDVISYTVTKAGQLTYNFSTFSYKVGIDIDGNGYADDLSDKDLPSRPTWYDANDKSYIPASYRYPATSYIPGNLGYNGYVYADLVNPGFYWHLSVALNTHTENANYVKTYDYLDLTATAPFALTDYTYFSYFESTINYSQGASFTQDGLRISLNGNYPNYVFFTNGVNTRTYPYVTMKIQVAAPGTYTVDLDAGAVSELYANYKVYIAPVEGTTVSSASDLMKEQYYIGNLDASVNASGTLQNQFVANSAGEYYVCFQYAMDGENYSRTSGTMNTNLKSLTLTPVAADTDGYTVTQQAVLSSDIQMQFTVNATGSLIAGYDVLVGDEVVGTVPVQTGVDKTISVSLCASQMSKIITLQPIDGNGDAVGEARTYSLREYLVKLMNDPAQSAETVALAKNTYNYCAKAQIQFNKDTDRLTDTVEVTPAEPGSYTATSPVSGTTTGITAYSATLMLENLISVRFYFTLDAGQSIDSFTFQYNDDTMEPVKSGSRYYVEVTEINPQMYNTPIEIKVTNGTEGSLTVTYSPMDYIQRNYHKEGTPQSLKDLLQAMNGYHDAACAYIDANPQT